jgi:hypothetical protein
MGIAIGVIIAVCVIIATYQHVHTLQAIRAKINTPEPQPKQQPIPNRLYPEDLRRGNLVCCKSGDTILGYLEVNAVAPEGIEARNIDDIEYHIYQWHQIHPIETFDYRNRKLIDRLFNENTINNTYHPIYIAYQSVNLRAIHEFQNYIRLAQGIDLTLKAPVYSRN